MSIFISYSRQDQAYVNKLLEALTKHELPWWLDNKIDYGDKWPRVIEENLRKSQVFMLVMSPRSKNSHWVNCELALALELKKPIFPLLLEGSRWLEVGIIQTVDIQGGKLPPASFFDRVRSELNNKVRSADYNQAIKIKPDYADAYNNRGIAKKNLGDKQGAIADYNQAIKIKPDYADAYNNADYNQAIKIKPDYADAYNNRGIAKKNLGDKQGAIADYNQAAQLYSQQGNMEK
ncbi:MAG: toll/interleukin-1 receptor domain-containing protein [Microcystis panniformis Mp_MB_F_20051200_S9]|uniref:Toll/interleukin-1 receptor domain-containing protein n=1 Tax=Microcystis panniformis Mp_MB_F_20051200_S9 TaxID=2486223 RepID=A0A552Q5D6_9CHRO|nr:MAG: toll/interleukin-1 receptor domain-containing protein [Microcystis panniformis Mp_MB_F_20051200_S9]